MKDFLVPKSPLLRSRSAVDRLWNELLKNFPVDITEDETEVHMRAELPGVSKKDLSVEIYDNVLIIKVEKKDIQVHETAFMLQSENSFGTIQRSFSLGRSIDESDINASYKDGILTITLKKAGENFKKIEIS